MLGITIYHEPMKMKLVYIGIAALALGFASCSKEDIRPNAASSDAEVPFFTKSSSTTNSGSVLTDPNGGGNDGGGIVDPEKNEEESQLNDGQ